MRNLNLTIIILFTCIAFSNYYSVNKKYTTKNNDCIPKSSLMVEYKENNIEQYTNQNNKSIRKKPIYKKID